MFLRRYWRLDTLVIIIILLILLAGDSSTILLNRTFAHTLVILSQLFSFVNALSNIFSTICRLFCINALPPLYTVCVLSCLASLSHCSLAEVPECRLKIASTPHVVEHLIDAMLSSTYTYTCARSGVCAIMCLSFSMETHQYLCRDAIVSSILEICDKTHSVGDNTSAAERQTNQILVE